MTQPTQNASSPGAEADRDSIAEHLQAPAKSHPTQKQLREFMQLLLREFLLEASNPKQWLPLEVLLEVSYKECFGSAVGAGLGGHGHHKGRGCPERPESSSFFESSSRPSDENISWDCRDVVGTEDLCTAGRPPSSMEIDG